MRMSNASDTSLLLLHASWMAMLGVLCRLLLLWLFQFSPATSFAYADLPANVLGSLVMGFSVTPRSQYVLLQSAVTKGFCGSLTSFSSWMLATAAALLRCSGAWCVLSVVYQLLSSWLLCLAAYRLGRLASLAFAPPIPGETLILSLSPSTCACSGLKAGLCCSGSMAAAALWMALQPGVMPASLLLAPVGAGLRISLGLLFERGGTLASNVLGCVLTCVGLLMWLAAGQEGAPSVAAPGAVSLPALAVLAAAISFGLAGALSTVSTLVHEVWTLSSEPAALAYGLITVLLGLAVCLVMAAPVFFRVRPF